MCVCVHVHVCLFFSIGELLGVDYLLSQTGQPLKLNPDSKETEDMLEDVDEEEGGHEGFKDDQTPDFTVPGLLDNVNFSVSFSSQPCPSSENLSSSQPFPSQPAATLIQPDVSLMLDSASPDEFGVCKYIMCKENHCICSLSHFAELKFCGSSLFFQSVDDSGMPGMDRVDGLAEYLVELRNQSSHSLTNQQVRNIYCLATGWSLSYIFILARFFFSCAVTFAFYLGKRHCCSVAEPVGL